MKKTLLAISIITAMILLSGCISEGEDLVDEDPCKEGAMQFSLEVLQTFFDNDLNAFLNLLSDEVYSMEGEGPYSKTDVEGFLSSDEDLMGAGYTAYTMEEYESTYDPRILDEGEMNTEFPGILDDMKVLGWDFGENDFVFLGYETFDGTEGPLW